MSSGCVILTPHKINSDVFIMSIDKLNKWVSDLNNFNYVNSIMTMDNC